MKVWIYYREKFRQLDKKDPRFDWTYHYAPEGTVKFQRTKKLWEYVSYGDTAEHAARNKNAHLLRDVESHEQQIKLLRSRMVWP